MHYLNNLDRLRKEKLQSYKLKIRNKKKIIIKRILKTILMIVSLSGLIYQVQIICKQYFSGKTTISVEILQTPSKSPPAITICFQGLLSMERAAKFLPGFKEISKTYFDIARYGNKFKLKKFYRDTFLNYTEENLKKDGLDLNELFDNISVKYESLDKNSKYNRWTILLKFLG